jgi:hypothetical protein
MENQQPSEQKAEATEAKVTIDTTEPHTDLIHYEDGKVEKKEYGDQIDPNEVLQTFAHLIERTNQTVTTFVTRVDKALTVGDFCTLLSEKAKIAVNNP